MNLPEPQSVTFTSLFAEIGDGTIKIPQFQREFVWSRAQSAKLLDSIVKGYPIGTFIVWKTNERLRSIRNLGAVILPDTPDGDAVKYVLDGQQRLTSLYATLNGLTIHRLGRDEDYSAIWVDLGAGEEDEIVKLDNSECPPPQCILLKDLLHGKLQYLASFPEEYQEKIQNYKTRITSYQFSLVMIKDAPLDVATEIFTRLNVGGKALTPFEIMVAKTYDENAGFDLSVKVDELKEHLRKIGYETISPMVMLQTVSIISSGDCRGRTILKLTRKQVVETWPKAAESLIRAAEYFRGFFRIPVSHLLPYSALIIPFAYFFNKHPNKPAGDIQARLADFFWRSSLGGRYSQSMEGHLSQDINKVNEIIQGQLPKYEWTVDVSADFLSRNGYFSASRSFIKALLCLLAYQDPKSFNDNATVRLDNAFLKRANSKNFHHFFPTAWLKKQPDMDLPSNHIANITLVDDCLNKNLIRAKSPADYMQTFSQQNPEIRSCMKTHLIELGDDWGVIPGCFQSRSQQFPPPLLLRPPSRDRPHSAVGAGRMGRVVVEGNSPSNPDCRQR